MDIETTVITEDMKGSMGQKITGKLIMQFDDDIPCHICYMYDDGKLTLELGKSGCIEFRSGQGKTFKLLLVPEE